ncbi:MAG: mevalonate kinase [Chloroflexi bacterium]|nr:mevalonate kinase [Chloroflexota bacterium]
MTTSSAPGKIILFGEHAVVYGRPALAVPVTQVQATATVSENSRGGIRVEAPNINLSSDLSRLAPDHPLAAVINSVFSALSISSPSDCTVYIQSTIPVAAGLWSGAAVSVAVIRALSEFLGQPLPNERVSTLAYEAEKFHHGTPSGIDNTVITYARPVYFIKSKPIEIFSVGKPFTLVIGDTGIPAPTKESVSDVRRLWETDKTRWGKVFDEIEKIVHEAKKKIESGEWKGIGSLMDQNHALLQELTVSSVELDRLVAAGRRSGALGAKLSGGGRGGNMIALVEKENAPAVAEAFRSAGAKRTIVTQVG